MNGSGKNGNNRKRPFRPQGRDNEQDGQGQNRKRKNVELPRYDKNRGGFFERPKWTPPKLSADPLPSPDCSWCGKPIKDITTAITDRETGKPVHFDCVLARLGQEESLEKGDAITYIGGGRFGVVHFDNSPAQGKNGFKIKKIFELENKEAVVPWRASISDQFSLT